MDNNSKISVVIGFKNREIERVINCVQSLAHQDFTSFELIFVDYGSDEQLAIAVQQRLAPFAFVKYVYNDVRGMCWNRSHALNCGWKLATGELILFADIDLVFEPNYLHNLSKLPFDHQFYTFNCYYLPEGTKAPNNKTDALPTGTYENYVGLCAVSAVALNEINGFDEFYMVWGIEDDDLYQRLQWKGYQRQMLSATDFSSYHQWHASHYRRKPGYWYVSMVQHYMGKSNLTIEKGTIGRLYQSTERELLQLVFHENWQQLAELPLYKDQHFLFHPFYEAFYKLSTGSCAVFQFQIKAAQQGRLQPIANVLNKVFNLMPLFNYKLVSGNKKESDEVVAAQLMDFLIHFIGNNSLQMADYYLDHGKERLLFLVQKK